MTTTDASSAIPPGRGADTGSSLDAVARKLELDVVLGRMVPGQRLIEDDLMVQFAAKRHVVRSALTRLEGRGLIQRRQNKGARIRAYGPDEVEALYAYREDLHASAIRRMDLPLPPETVATLRRLAGEHEAAIECGDLATVIVRNDAFHDTLYGQCGNPFLTDAIRGADVAANAIRSFRIGDPALLRQAASEHLRMIEAARGGDREALDRLCRDHIAPSRDLYLRDQRRRADRAGPRVTVANHAD